MQTAIKPSTKLSQPIAAEQQRNRQEINFKLWRSGPILKLEAHKSPLLSMAERLWPVGPLKLALRPIKGNALSVRGLEEYNAQLYVHCREN